MKKLLFILLLSISFIGYSQTEVIIEQPSTFEEMFTKYGSELIESVKNGTDIVITEAHIIIKQYLIYNAIGYGLKLILGLLLIFWISKKIYSLFTIKKSEYDEHNNEIDANEDNRFSKPKKYIRFMKSYFRTPYHAMSSSVIVLLPIIFGGILIFNNILIFIKITFFSKLYLTEVIIDLIK